MDGTVKPFVILTAAGEVAAVLNTNEKGFRKSLENSCIWAVDPNTGRLLPEDELGSAGSFADKPGWYQAELHAVKEEGQEQLPSENSPEAGCAAAEQTGAAGAESGAAGTWGSGAVTSGAVTSAVIERLYDIIVKRKNEMPEGSYTTHLFNSGLSKIRKKTGEEAIELLLAENRDEIIYEASDLVYHMLVLLAAEDISPAEIFKELVSRE